MRAAVELRLTATPKAVPELRRRLCAYDDDVRLCATELLTNVIEHVGDGTPVRVRVVGLTGSGRTRIEVTDPDPCKVPAVLPATETAECGRGLLLVSALAQTWGVERGETGKTVWCELAGDDGAVVNHGDRDEKIMRMIRRAPTPLRSAPPDSAHLMESYVTQHPRRARALSRLAAPAIAVALVGTAAGTAVAAPYKPTPAAPSLFLSGVLPSGQMYVYMADGTGGFDERSGAYVWPHFRIGVSVDPDLTGWQDGAYHVMADGTLNLWRGGRLKKIASGWGQYDTVFSPGTLTGARHPDLLARDKKGVLWRYQSKTGGSLAARVEVGTGWNQYTQIAGEGDLSGDRKPDVVARDKKGVLWLYKGTGEARKPFASRSKAGSGWNQYDRLVTTGDVDRDGHSDLLARDKKGVLWLFKGTGKSASPFKSRVKVGSGFNQYRVLF
ncbi:ATP-binding protein [Streptomyces sp. NPDC047813]|uniref:ATP-binding protein n=1 Tax=Streptomyces sp. NPDC047813 TaxID=3154608 RepID=UPI0033D76E15